MRVFLFNVAVFHFKKRGKRDWIFLIVFLAFLQMRSRLNFFFFFSEDLSVLSEDVASLMSPDEHFENDWLPSHSHNSIQDAEYGQELVSKGNPKAEVQLRYVNYFLSNHFGIFHQLLFCLKLTCLVKLLFRKNSQKCTIFGIFKVIFVHLKCKNVARFARYVE